MRSVSAELLNITCSYTKLTQQCSILPLIDKYKHPVGNCLFLNTDKNEITDLLAIHNYTYRFGIEITDHC